MLSWIFFFAVGADENTKMTFVVVSIQRCRHLLKGCVRSSSLQGVKSLLYYSKTSVSSWAVREPLGAEIDRCVSDSDITYVMFLSPHF